MKCGNLEGQGRSCFSTFSSVCWIIKLYRHDKSGKWDLAMLSSISYQNFAIGCWALNLGREVWDLAVTSVRPLCHVSSHLSCYCQWRTDLWAAEALDPSSVTFSSSTAALAAHWAAAQHTYCFLTHLSPDRSCSAELLFSTFIVSCQAASLPIHAAELQSSIWSHHIWSAPTIHVRSSLIHLFSIVLPLSFWFCSFPF